MNIQAEKIALAKMLLETENPRIIASIKKYSAKKIRLIFGMIYLQNKKKKYKKPLWK